MSDTNEPQRVLTVSQVNKAQALATRILKLGDKSDNVIFIGAMIAVMSRHCYRDANGDITRALTLADSLVSDLRRMLFAMNAVRKANEKN